ncbi:MAG: molybdenum cofactor carrier [Bacteroidetes bacterium]|nr:molybdenum cofactor carrier [Bacteroidota bacterium]
MEPVNVSGFKIISGGQTGVDRAALDFAIMNHIACGGFCPKGRKAEDGTISLNYPLTEMDSASYPERTRQNIIASDGTLLLYFKKLDRGSLLTKKLCYELNKPLWFQSMDEKIDPDKFKCWIKEEKINILNIAGPRESFSKGIYFKTLEFMNTLHFY